MAELYATEHHERVLEPQDVETALRRLIWHFDEPFGDHSFLPTYYLTLETRREGCHAGRRRNSNPPGR